MCFRILHFDVKDTIKQTTQKPLTKRHMMF